MPASIDSPSRRNLTRKALRPHGGFTLIELVFAITITGILAGITSVFIMRPVQGYFDLSRRAALVDASESALRRMARDIRIALPNSVRITNTSGGGFALELIPIVDGGKYTTTGAVSVKINLHGDFDQDFDNLGCFHAIAPGTYTNYRIVINNLGTSGYDAYASPQINKQGNTTGVITAGGVTITITNNAGANCPSTGDQHIHFSQNHAFLDSSPQNRFFVVEKPVTYLCDKAAGTLTRYASYDFQSSQLTTAAALNALPGVTSALVANRISACSVSTSAQDVRNRGLATLDLSLAESGETVRLIHQAQLDNSR